MHTVGTKFLSYYQLSFIQCTKMILILVFVFHGNILLAQTLLMHLVGKESNRPVAYANIGIPGKNVGTVSDEKGKFEINIGQEYKSDSIIISCIGYKPEYIHVADLYKYNGKKFSLQEVTFVLHEVLINPNAFKMKILGVSSSFKGAAAGFSENKLGYELGIQMKNKKLAVIKKLIINLASCSYDSVFFRINVYKMPEDGIFENVLREPIFLNLGKSEVDDTIEMDLSKYNIQVEGDFLVTLEHVKDLGDGHLYFCAGIGRKTFFRKTSQAYWETVAIGVSISVEALVER